MPNAAVAAISADRQDQVGNEQIGHVLVPRRTHSAWRPFRHGRAESRATPGLVAQSCIRPTRHRLTRPAAQFS